MLIIGTLILYFLMLIFVVYSVKKTKSKKNLLQKLGFKKTNLGKAILQGFFYLGLLILVSVIVGEIFYSFGQEKDLGKVPNIIQQADITYILIALTVASFVEEIFFRGYLQRKTNLWIASFIFGYFHIIYGSFSEVIGAFFLGLVLGISFIRTKNLFVPIFSHFWYNIISVIIIVLA